MWLLHYQKNGRKYGSRVLYWDPCETLINSIKKANKYNIDVNVQKLY